MSNRFEVVQKETVVKDSVYHSFTIFRDKQTGMMYLETKHGLTPLLGKDGKPVGATYQVSI